jgi:tRNA U34 5-carboxymethylaminomethyl modifying GTPase MnmE/TrmE
VPGTTRDLVTESRRHRGLRVTLVDTAGCATTDDPSSRRRRASRAGAAVADLVLTVSIGRASDAKY